MSSRVYTYNGRRFEVDDSNKRCVKVSIQDAHGFVGVSLAGIPAKRFTWVVIGQTFYGIDTMNDFLVTERGISEIANLCSTFAEALDGLCNSLIMKQTHDAMEDFIANEDEIIAKSLEREIEDALNRLTEEE